MLDVHAKLKLCMQGLSMSRETDPTNAITEDSILDNLSGVQVPVCESKTSYER